MVAYADHLLQWLQRPTLEQRLREWNRTHQLVCVQTDVERARLRSRSLCTLAAILNAQTDGDQPLLLHHIGQLYTLLARQLDEPQSLRVYRGLSGDLGYVAAEIMGNPQLAVSHLCAYTASHQIDLMECLSD